MFRFYFLAFSDTVRSLTSAVGKNKSGVTSRKKSVGHLFRDSLGIPAEWRIFGIVAIFVFLNRWKCFSGDSSEIAITEIIHFRKKNDKYIVTIIMVSVTEVTFEWAVTRFAIFHNESVNRQNRRISIHLNYALFIIHSNIN